jgi:transcriptional regulator NrdR family protein
MTCPTCSSPTRVIDSREDEGVSNVRRRRHACRSCGTRFSTYEVTADEYNKMRAMRINTTQIDSTIATLRSIKAQFGATNGKD